MRVLNEKEVNELIKSDKLVVVDFFATWCGPCKMLAPILEEVASEITDVEFVKVDIDNDQKFALANNVTAVPTVVAFKNGQAVSKFVGFQPKPSIVNFVNSAK